MHVVLLCSFLAAANIWQIPNRKQFKHVVFGPKLWSSYEGDLFPAVRDLVDAGEWDKANQTLAKIAVLFEAAAAHLLE